MNTVCWVGTKKTTDYSAQILSVLYAVPMKQKIAMPRIDLLAQ